MEPYSFEEMKDGDHILMATQQEAIDLIKSGKNVFLTGGAGRGKSYVIKQVMDKHTILAAPTGVSALNIGGQTCHRTFGLPMGLPTMDDYNKVGSKVKKLLGSKHLKRVVLDEAGMTRADYMDLIDHRLKQCRGNNLPFGGVQVVAVGDFFQLSPIVGQRERNLFFKQYSTPFAFGANSWNFETCTLEENFRTGDKTQSRVLDSFRTGDKWTARAIEWMGENCLPYDEEEDVLHLCAYKVDAERINQLRYSELTTKEVVYHGTTNNSKWSNDVAVPQIVRLKEGATIVIRANDPEGSYVNGQRGTIKKLFASSAIVTLENGEEVEVVPFLWESHVYNSTAKGLTKTVEFMYSQLPIQLGYATTIHAAQGLTLDRYVIDMGRGAFAHGMTYVAASRARDLTKVSIATPLTLRDVIIEPEVKQFYGELK